MPRQRNGAAERADFALQKKRDDSRRAENFRHDGPDLLRYIQPQTNTDQIVRTGSVREEPSVQRGRVVFDAMGSRVFVRLAGPEIVGMSATSAAATTSHATTSHTAMPGFQRRRWVILFGLPSLRRSHRAPCPSQAAGRDEGRRPVGLAGPLPRPEIFHAIPGSAA